MSDSQPDSGGEVADGSAAVDTFVAMTGCEPQQAGFLLEASGWDLDAAVQLYFGAPRGTLGSIYLEGMRHSHHLCTMVFYLQLHVHPFTHHTP